MNYIFLDIDGVLNNSHSLSTLKGEWGLCSASVRILSLICKKFDAKVVLSSSWRRNLKDDLTLSESCLKVKEWNARRGITGEIDTELLLRTLRENNIPLIGKTDEKREREIGWDRLGQIHRYIKGHLDKNDNFIIIDDEDVFGDAAPITDEEEKLYSHFIRTSFDRDGLDKSSYLKACKIFNKVAGLAQ